MRGHCLVFILIIGVVCGEAHLFAAEKVRVAYPALATALSPSWVTSEKGLWKKHGLDVELILLSGGARTIPGLISGSVQVIIGADTGVTTAILKGMDLVRLGVTTNSLGSSLVTRPKIGSIKDLKGKTLGISMGRDASYARLAKVLVDHGIDPKADVKLLPIGGGESGRLGALRAGVIDGTMLFPPLDLVAKNEGLKIALKFDVPTIAGGINTTRQLLKQNRQLLINFLKGYMEGIDYMTKNKDDSLEVFSKYLKSSDREAMSHLYDEIAGRVERGLQPNMASVRFLLDLVALDDPRAKQLSERDHWDLGLIEEIRQSGFLEAMGRRQ